jgi:hypothetical protein
MSGFQQKKKVRIVVHVFSGGSGSTVLQFSIALARFRSCGKFDIEVTYVTNKDIRENKDNKFTTPELFYLWLLACDIFFVPSQGVWLGLITSGLAEQGWNVPRIEGIMTKLSVSNHIGFPFGTQLLEPVWSGNKCGYIDLMPELCIPTLKIDLTQIISEDDFRKVANLVIE